MLGIGLVIGIPTTLMLGVFTVLAYRDGQLLASLALLAFVVLLGLPLIYWSVRLRLVANEQGLFVAKEFRTYRIPWSDLDFIEMVFHPGSSEVGPSAALWIVTRQGRRISPTTGTNRDDVPWLARILIAMRDEYSPDSRGPAAAPLTHVASTPLPGFDPPSGGAPPPGGGTRRVVVVRLREASGNAAPPNQLRTWRGGFKADRDGIRIRGSIKRIPWRDVEGIDFDSGRTASDSDTRVVLVTRGHGRIHLPHLTGSPTPGHKAYEIAQTLLAMRDAHTSEDAHPSATPTDTATPTPVVPPLAYGSPPETESTTDGDHG